MSELDCCANPKLVELRRLGGSPRKGIATERCSSCGGHWLHAWNEIAMGGDFEEVDFDTFARLTEEEAARLPAPPTRADLAFLADRTVLETQFGGTLRRREGWPS
jgi:hypothetical protein